MPETPPPELEHAVLDRDGRREGNEIRFRCPYPENHQHGDANPSARYHPDKGVWRCDVCQEHGGWTNLCEVLDVSWQGRSAIVATYPYTDEVGDLLFEVVRKAPKAFRQRRPDGCGGRVWNLEGVRRVLYRLPEVVEAVQDGRVVYVVEGEKDADYLAKLGLVATTNPGGAGKWRSEYSEILRGARVVLLNDNDKAGEAHLQKVAQALHGVASEVRWLGLPDLPAGGDVSDWIAAERKAGRGQDEIRSQLEELTAGASTWTDTDGGGDDGIAVSSASSDKPTQSEVLLRLALEGGIQLFHTPGDEAFVQVPVGGHQATWAVRSKSFRRWLLHAYYTLTDKAPGAQAIQDALGTLEARACYEGEVHEVSTRIAQLDGAIYLDLCNPKWEAVEITRDGWQVISRPPVRFRRASGVLPLPPPARGGSIADLRSLVNLPDERSFALFAAFLVASLRPRGPYPLLVLQGEQGSSKSTLARMARALVDPAGAPLRTVPRNERDLMISATHAWVLAFDNLSGIPDWLSDALCRLATGGGFSARQLYTDAEEVIFSAMRPVILNGIDDVVGRQDLVDRSIVLNLPTIAETDRRREEEIRSDFEARRPRLLGALLDAVSGALRNAPSVRLERSPRMADFAHWAVAAEPAFPWPQGTFLAAYEGNRQEAVEVSLDADLVATALRTLISHRGAFEGTCQELLTLIESQESESTRKSRSWPKSPRGLSARLKRAAPALRQAGISIEQDRESGTGRRIVRIGKKDAASNRHNRHNRHEPPYEGDLLRDGQDLGVTVAAADRHGQKARQTSVCDGRDGCDGWNPLDSEPPDDGEELRL